MDESFKGSFMSRDTAFEGGVLRTPGPPRLSLVRTDEAGERGNTSMKTVRYVGL